MVSYEIDPTILTPLVPSGTELDFHHGITFVSMVGFLFLKTRVYGIPIPLHRNFEEVNLRFYVRRKTNEGWRRGVVFIKELVPRWAIAFSARMLYNERYTSLPMAHHIELLSGERGSGQSISYSWRHNGIDSHLKMVAYGAVQEIRPDSVEEFISEHYWGYSSQRDGSVLEYRVEHPRWKIREAGDTNLRCESDDLYGRPFVDMLKRPPSSAFLAEGSAVRVFKGVRLVG